jgi:hypothetical protein
MKKILLITIINMIVIMVAEGKDADEFERLIIEGFTGKKVVIWEEKQKFKDLNIRKYYELDSLENIVLERIYNSQSGKRDNTIRVDFIFKIKDERRTVRRRFVYSNITSWDLGAIDEGMKIGNYGLKPYLWIKTGRLESGHAAWGNFYNFYYGKNLLRPYSQWINLDMATDETLFLIWDESLIKAWNVFTGKEKNNLRGQSELEDLLTIPQWIKPSEIQKGERVALYWDECIILETKEENGKYVYVICIKGKTNETLYRNFLLETGRGPRGNMMTRDIVYAQYLGNDKEGKMRFREVENWF